MRYCKTSPRKFRFDKALVVFECLVQLLRKRFMCRLRKHTVSQNKANMSPIETTEFKQCQISSEALHISYFQQSGSSIQS